tara:strand:- start:7384 stop:8316 length:933 start_codon:yes stop_codon:yes gene_type:complete
MEQELKSQKHQSKKNRLFVFGCSFTMYAWPTYADFLSYEFDHYENWGFPGLGNRAIAERIAECHVKNNLTKDDTVIVQWSTHTRNDWHTFRTVEFKGKRGDAIRNTDEIGWKTKGSIFNYMNREVCYDDKWIETFWDEHSYYMHGQNAIILTQGLLESTGCTWRMTSIGHMNKLGTDMPNINDFGETPTDTVDVYKERPELKVYENIDKTNWLEPLGLFAWTRKEKHYTFYDPESKEDWMEPHPSHWQHYDYLNEVVRPSLGLKSKNNDKQHSTVELLDKLKDENHDLLSFEEAILKEVVDYNHIGYVGF